MNTLNFNKTLVDNYFELLKNLSAEGKKEIIARLTKSLSKEPSLPAKKLPPNYDDFIPEKTADELIKELREARTPNSNRAEL